MQTQTETQNRTETKIGDEIQNELKDRVIGKYQCTISRGNREILEKTYEMINGRLSYVCINYVHENHPRYVELSDKLSKEGI